MSGSIPVNIGVGNIMNSCFASSWATLAAVGISSIAAPGPARPKSNASDRLVFHDSPNGNANAASRSTIYSGRPNKNMAGKKKKRDGKKKSGKKKKQGPRP